MTEPAENVAVLVHTLAVRACFTRLRFVKPSRSCVACLCIFLRVRLFCRLSVVTPTQLTPSPPICFERWDPTAPVLAATTVSCSACLEILQICFTHSKLSFHDSTHFLPLLNPLSPNQLDGDDVIALLTAILQVRVTLLQRAAHQIALQTRNARLTQCVMHAGAS